MKVEIYSDVACPWCYIGKERFERALAAFPGREEVEVVFRSYQLDPRTPAAARPMQEYLTERFGERGSGMTAQVEAAARGEGIRMDFDSALAANTFSAHRLLNLAAREYGNEVQRALTQRLFEAYFSEGKDVSDPEVLAGLAEDAGMDADRARDYLAGTEGAEEVRAEIAGAQRLGISAVPTFIFEGRYAVQGAQPASAFLQALETVARETAAAAPQGAATGDACDDGSCAV